MDRWTDKLSEYLDATLDSGERSELDSHLEGCAECRSMLEGLRGVVARAQALEDRAPKRDLWATIAQDIGAERPVVRELAARRSHRLTFSVPQLLAASIALILLSGGAVWLAATRRVTGVGSIPQTVVTSGDATPQATRVAWATDPRYDAAIAELQAAVQAGRKSGQLDSATIRVVERNLAIIDSAIVQARRALAADPHSAYLNHHLADTMRRKLDLLRQATALAGART